MTPILNLWARAYFRWALREMPPTHPDVPFVVRKLNELESPMTTYHRPSLRADFNHYVSQYRHLPFPRIRAIGKLISIWL
jgi:hypothetical protein